MIFFFCGLSLDTSDWNIFRKKKKKKNVIKIFEVLFKNNNVIAFNTFIVFINCYKSNTYLKCCSISNFSQSNFA